MGPTRKPPPRNCTSFGSGISLSEPPSSEDSIAHAGSENSSAQHNAQHTQIIRDFIRFLGESPPGSIVTPIRRWLYKRFTSASRVGEQRLLQRTAESVQF